MTEPQEPEFEADDFDPADFSWDDEYLRGMTEENRRLLYSLVRDAIESLDFAQWETELFRCCDGDCHLVVMKPNGQFRVWCACLDDWVTSET